MSKDERPAEVKDERFINIHEMDEFASRFETIKEFGEFGVFAMLNYPFGLGPLTFMRDDFEKAYQCWVKQKKET